MQSSQHIPIIFSEQITKRLCNYPTIIQISKAILLKTIPLEARIEVNALFRFYGNRKKKSSDNRFHQKGFNANRKQLPIRDSYRILMSWSVHPKKNIGRDSKDPIWINELDPRRINQSPKGNMWSAKPSALLCMFVNERTNEQKNKRTKVP